MTKQDLPISVRAENAFAECGRCCGVSAPLETEILEALERARVVGVLDAWASNPRRGTTRHIQIWPASDTFQCRLWSGFGEGVIRDFGGPTPDAARAAAKAIEVGEV